MGFFSDLLGGDGAHRDDPTSEEQLAELEGLGFELRHGRDPDAALPERLNRRDPHLAPFYRYLFNGAAVPRHEAFQAGPVTGSRAVQIRLDGAGLSLDEPQVRPLEAAEVEARAAAVAAALAADLGAARRLAGVAVRWDPAAQQGRADLSIDHRTISVQIGDGHLRNLALAVISALTPARSTTLAFVDPLDVENPPSPWLWLITVPSSDARRFQDMLKMRAHEVLDRLERWPHRRWPSPRTDLPATWTQPGAGLPLPAGPVDAPEVTTDNEQVVRRAVERAHELGFTPRAEIRAADVVWHLADATDLHRHPLRSVLAVEDDDGRPVFDRVLGYDNEFVDHDEAYVELLRRLAEAAGTTSRIGDTTAEIDFEGQTVGTVSYTVDGRPRRYEVVVDRDWGDPEVPQQMAEDVAPDGCTAVLHDETFYWVPRELEGDFAVALEAPAGRL